MLTQRCFCVYLRLFYVSADIFEVIVLFCVSFPSIGGHLKCSPQRSSVSLLTQRWASQPCNVTHWRPGYFQVTLFGLWAKAWSSVCIHTHRYMLLRYPNIILEFHHFGGLLAQWPHSTRLGSHEGSNSTSTVQAKLAATAVSMEVWLRFGASF